MALWFLRRMISRDLRERVLGDFEEIYATNGNESHRFESASWYWKQIMKSFPFFVFDNIHGSATMLFNHLKIAFRNLKKYKVHSTINITGLALAIAFCILAFLFVQHETSYDTFHEEGDRIYLTLVQTRTYGDRKPSGSSPPILAPTLTENIPEIESAIRVFGWYIKDGTPVSYDDKILNMSGYYVDPGFFSMFSFPRIAGNLDMALNDDLSIVISQSMAETYFGNEEALGKRLKIRLRNGVKDLFVTGVVSVPKKSSLHFDFVISYALRGKVAFNWGSNNLYTFVRVAEGIQASDLEHKVKLFFESYFKERNDDRRSQEYALRLLHLKDLYLNTVIQEWLTLQSDPKYSYILSGIALAMLLIACVNFVNLSIGLSSTRMREVGMRKVVGASRAQLIKQYLSESLFMSFLALMVGILLASLILPTFNRLMNRYLTVEIHTLGVPLLVLVVTIGVFAGIYPALILSGFHPVAIFRGFLKIGGTSVMSRVLVILQFAMSIVLIIATLTMSRQMRHLRNINLGFKGEQVVVIDGGGSSVGLKEGEIRQVLALYRQRALHDENLLSVTMSSMSFGRGNYWGTGLYIEDRRYPCRVYSVDFDYLQTLGIPLLQGRDFSRDFPGDVTGSILVNETLVNTVGWEDPIGMSIPSQNDQLQGRVIGVVKDTYLRSMHDELAPAVYHLKAVNGSYRYIFIRIRPNEIPMIIDDLRTIWREAVPYRPFIFSFLDDDVDRIFREDERWVEVARFSSLIAVFIACMGAFGLTSLTVVRRTKEVGIRKVLGASVPIILRLLTKEFLFLVLLANTIAWPAAWFFLQDWLQDFVYRIGLGPGMFLLGAVLTLLIVLFTVSIQVLRVARANPVESLRYE